MHQQSFPSARYLDVSTYLEDVEEQILSLSDNGRPAGSESLKKLGSILGSHCNCDVQEHLLAHREGRSDVEFLSMPFCDLPDFTPSFRFRFFSFPCPAQNLPKLNQFRGIFETSADLPP
jgi:hypothetical protein